MILGASVLLIALGATLLFAVTTTLAGVSVNTIGVILVIAGVVGLLIGLIGVAHRDAAYWTRWRRFMAVGRGRPAAVELAGGGDQVPALVEVDGDQVRHPATAFATAAHPLQQRAAVAQLAVLSRRWREAIEPMIHQEERAFRRAAADLA